MIYNANDIYLRALVAKEYENKKQEKIRKKNERFVCRDINNIIRNSANKGEMHTQIWLRKEDFSLKEVEEISNKYISKDYICNINNQYDNIYLINISWEKIK